MDLHLVQTQLTISPNDQDKMVYFVQNSTSQTATFTQGSGGNVSVAAGSKKIIFADGAGSGATLQTCRLLDSLMHLVDTKLTSTATELKSFGWWHKCWNNSRCSR